MFNRKVIRGMQTDIGGLRDSLIALQQESTRRIELRIRKKTIKRIKKLIKKFRPCTKLVISTTRKLNTRLNWVTTETFALQHKKTKKDIITYDSLHDLEKFLGGLASHTEAKGKKNV